jgi:putative SOS response-associated peptidase YedK
MCSRYTLTSPHEAVRAYFGYLNEAVFPPRYNIAPSQPVAIVRNTYKHEPEMALAGLYENWLGADGSEIETMAILTTAANRDLEHIHDRMPVIVDLQDFDRWLDCSPGSSVPIEDILRPLPEGRLSIAAVSRKINKAGIEGPELQQSLPF